MLLPPLNEQKILFGTRLLFANPNLLKASDNSSVSVVFLKFLRNLFLLKTRRLFFDSETHNKNYREIENKGDYATIELVMTTVLLHSH